MSNNNSKAPLIIIAAVVVAALVGVYFLMNRDKTPTPPANKASNATSTPAVNAPGADPPRMLGSEKATVVVEEFADFQCPTCAATHPKMKEIQSAYGSRIKFIFREFPLRIPAHDKAFDAAVAAEAAGLQGRFWEMQNLLFTNQATWSQSPDYKTIWEDYAKQIGINIEQWKNDMAGTPAKMRVQADLQRGNALQVNATPSIYVNGQLVPPAAMGDVSAMRQIIDAELAKAPAAATSPAAAAAPAANSNK